MRNPKLSLLLGLLIITAFVYSTNSIHNETKNISADGQSVNAESIHFFVDDDHRAPRGITQPVVATTKVTGVTNASATVHGNLVATGGETCSVWFEWDEYSPGGCAGIIATGTVCKDSRSIILKNRHTSEDNQQPRFFKGAKFAYFGVGSF